MSTRLPGAKYKRVFDRGRPLRGRLLAAWRLESADADRQAGVVVSKKTFHDAVDRNRAKRQVREAYRHAKQPLCDAIAADESLLVAFVWISDQQAPSAIVSSRVGKLVGRMAEKI